MTSIRNVLSREDRVREAEPTIDPGFVNQRLVETVLGEPGMRAIDEMIHCLPPYPDWQHEIRLAHVYKDVLLRFCDSIGVPPLGRVLARQEHALFSSIEILSPCKEIYDAERVISRWVPSGSSGWEVEFHYSTKWIGSDTVRMLLNEGAQIALVAQIHKREENRLICHPLVMGSPWLRTKDPEWEAQAMWYGRDFFEHFVEDIDEFARVREQPTPKSHEPMSKISESAFKACLAEILGGETSNDWGGETSDHYSSHVHLGGRRVTSAFLLKGPARYRAMSLNQLGKNNDQIVRLAEEPAEFLVVQHCHDILPAVRKTLRAFAVQPHKARRYCLIDGRDSLRLLEAYDLLGKALSLSET